MIKFKGDEIEIDMPRLYILSRNRFSWMHYKNQSEDVPTEVSASFEDRCFTCADWSFALDSSSPRSLCLFTSKSQNTSITGWLCATSTLTKPRYATKAAGEWRKVRRRCQTPNKSTRISLFHKPDLKTKLHNKGYRRSNLLRSRYNLSFRF